MSNKGNTTGAKLELLLQEAGHKLNVIRLHRTFSLPRYNIDELMKKFEDMDPPDVLDYINRRYAHNDEQRMKIMSEYISRFAFGPEYMDDIIKASQELKAK